MTESNDEPQIRKKGTSNSQNISKILQSPMAIKESRYARLELLNELKSHELVNKAKLPAINKSSSLSNHYRQKGEIINA